MKQRLSLTAQILSRSRCLHAGGQRYDHDQHDLSSWRADLAYLELMLRPEKYRLDGAESRAPLAEHIEAEYYVSVNLWCNSPHIFMNILVSGPVMVARMPCICCPLIL